MISGGAGAWRSRGSRDAMPKPVSHTWPESAWFQGDEHVLGLDVFVDQTALVDMAERRCQVNGKAQKTRQIERLLPSRSRTRSRGSPPGSARTRIVRPS